MFVLAGLSYVVTQLSAKPAATENFQVDSSPDIRAQYATLTGSLIPNSEPQVTPQTGLYANAKTPPAAIFPDAAQVPQPQQEELQSSVAAVAMNPQGLEATPDYSKGDSTYSELMGQNMKSSDFIHNNMTPFFGGRVKQNMNVDANSGILDSFAGTGKLQIKKQEVEQMFDSSRAPLWQSLRTGGECRFHQESHE